MPNSLAFLWKGGEQKKLGGRVRLKKYRFHIERVQIPNFNKKYLLVELKLKPVKNLANMSENHIKRIRFAKTSVYGIDKLVNVWYGQWKGQSIPGDYQVQILAFPKWKQFLSIMGDKHGSQRPLKWKLVTGKLQMSRGMWFPTMWHFDKCSLGRASATPVKLRNSKWCSDSSLLFIEYSSD